MIKCKMKVFNTDADTAMKEWDETTKNVAREIVEVLRQMLINNTPIKSGELRSGWLKNGGKMSYTVRESSGGFSITLYNRVPYATAVNDGHYSYNQFNVGGTPYVVKNRTVKYTQGRSDKTFVFGHFFVEKSLNELQYSNIVDRIYNLEIDKWWVNA